jgi:hypothetical protein
MKRNLLTALVISGLFCSSAYSQNIWSNVGPGTNFSVQALTCDSNNKVLYVGGVFTQAGTVPATIGIAKWDGANYSAVGQGLLVGTGISALLYNYTNGKLIAGGSFTNISGTTSKNIAEWNGIGWSPLGVGLDTSGTQAVVSALAIYNNELYAGGVFNKSGSTILSYIAKWDGTNWQPVGTGTNGKVSSLCVYNNELYAGGIFTNAGGVPVNNIARWNGTTWGDVGGGVVNYTGAISVSAMQVYTGGLYAAGTFTAAGSTVVKNIARWNGVNWGDVGGGSSDYTGAISVSALQVYHGELVAGGMFDSLGTIAANHIGKWNGSAWSAMGSGMNNGILTLQTMADTLYAGGLFTTADGNTSLFISEWKPNLLSVNDNMYETDNISLYPNPVQNKLWVSTNTTMNQNKKLNFTLFDAIGREVIKKENVKDEINFGGSTISPGLYFYKVTDQNNVVLKEGKIVFSE